MEFWCFAFFFASNLSCSSLTTLNTVSARKHTTVSKGVKGNTSARKRFQPKGWWKQKKLFAYPISKVFACAFSMYPTNFESLPTSSVCPNTRTEKYSQLNLYSYSLYETIFCHELPACKHALYSRLMGQRESGKKEERRECSFTRGLFTGW